MNNLTQSYEVILTVLSSNLNQIRTLKLNNIELIALVLTTDFFLGYHQIIP